MTENELLLLSSALWGLAWLGFAAWVLGFLTRPAGKPAAQSSFEAARRQKLRAGSWVYRWFEAGIDKLARRHARRPNSRLEKIRKDLVVAGEPLPITAEEYLAFRQLESFLVAVAAGLFAWFMSGLAVAGLVFGLIAAFGYQLLMGNRVSERARRRLKDLKKRLPFAIDLMALMMEAGATFQEAMGTAIKENRGTPLADEFGLVQRDIALGRTRQDALTALQQRLGDADLSEIIFAVNKGEELGTPLSQILRAQAEQMRLKRTQWLEKAAAEAQVSIVFPGLLIMVACLLIVVAPFLLGALYTPQ
jgi:tight adherence protein C